MGLSRKSRYYTRLLGAFIRKHRRLIIVAMVFGISLFSFLPKTYEAIFLKKAEKIGIIGQYDLGNLPLEVRSKISTGLTVINSDKSISPGLAESWEINDNGREYRFYLMEDLLWQDGSVLKAKDINYNFQDVATQAHDEKTLIFKLKEPFSPFPSIVSAPVFKEGLIGVNEYQIKSLSYRGSFIEEMVLTSRNKGSPKLIYRFYPTESTAKTAFKLGEVNMILNLNDLGALGRWPGVKIRELPEKNRFVAIFFNTQNEKTADKSFRQALAYAIVKDWPNRSLSPIHPDSWAYNPSVKDYKYDLENAKSLLGKTVEEEQSANITLTTVPLYLEIAEKIADDWQKIGIETNIETVNILPDDFEAFLLPQEIPSDPDQYFLWHSTQETNITGYRNPKIDKLLEDGRKTSGQQDRKSIYMDLQRFIVEDTPAIFLFHPVVYSIERD